MHEQNNQVESYVDATDSYSGEEGLAHNAAAMLYFIVSFGTPRKTEQTIS